MNFWQFLVLNIILVGLSFVIFWLKINTKFKISDKYKIELTKRKAFNNMLRSHIDLLLERVQYDPETEKELREFADSTINFLLWCTDEALYEYSLYMRNKMGKKIKFTNCGCIVGVEECLSVMNMVRKIADKLGVRVG